MGWASCACRRAALPGATWHLLQERNDAGLSCRKDFLAAAPSICRRATSCAVTAVLNPGPTRPRWHIGSGQVGSGRSAAQAGKEGAGSGGAWGGEVGLRE